MKTIQALLIILGATTVMAGQQSPVELILRTPRSSYVIGDPIPTSLIIQPANASQSLEYREDIIRNFYGNFIVIGPGGLPLKRLSDETIRIPVDASWIMVSNTEATVRSVDITDIYTEPYDIPELHSFSIPGDYEITYSASTAIRLSGNPDILWSGQINSRPLKITVTEVDASSLNAAYLILSGGNNDRGARLRALNKVRYSSGQLTAREVSLLRNALNDSDQEIKIKAIRTLGTKTSNESIKAISDILKYETDPFIRSEAIAALGHSNTPAARELVEKECTARKERSYRAAVVVLGSIGDETSINVLREIADTDMTEWVRERAMESIEKIEKRLKPQ